jgi:hypothetical protein
MARNDGLSHNLESPEEHGEGRRPPRGGTRPEGGFSEGSHGRGPTPYLKNKHGGHQAKVDAHLGVKGRGGSGIIGKGDGFKGLSEDVEHPQSHEEFERLGADDGVGGLD